MAVFTLTPQEYGTFILDTEGKFVDRNIEVVIGAGSAAVTSNQSYLFKQ